MDGSVVDGIWFCVARVFDDEGYADAAFVECLFAGSKRFVVGGGGEAAVVGEEDDEGVGIETEVSEGVEEAADD